MRVYQLVNIDVSPISGTRSSNLINLLETISDNGTHGNTIILIDWHPLKISYSYYYFNFEAVVAQGTNLCVTTIVDLIPTRGNELLFINIYY